jgi:hypothetical protein
MMPCFVAYPSRKGEWKNVYKVKKERKRGKETSKNA